MIEHKIKNKSQKEKRPGWDEYFIELARLICERSTCLRRRVGAVIVKNKMILSAGYNGVPSGLAHCSVTGCMREKMNIPSGVHHELCRGLHAEMNALLQAAYYGIDISGGIMYVTNQPCILCAKMIVNAEIKKIVIAAGYPDKDALSLFKKSKIKLQRI